MKRNLLAFMAIATSSIIVSCNSSGDSTTTTDSSTTSVSTPSITTDGAANADTSTMAAATMSSTPLGEEDKTFVMKAAGGGIMEVELGNIAQQNAASQRVKDFGAMMVRDHTKANDELSSLASAKGITINKDSLMNVHKAHIDAMRQRTGAAFDKSYMNMMVSDHETTIADFQKANNNATDADLKAWAGKTLPVLQMHLDSARAINQAVK